MSKILEFNRWFESKEQQNLSHCKSIWMCEIRGKSKIIKISRIKEWHYQTINKKTNKTLVDDFLNPY